jgi:hypothetical protein
MAKERKLMSRVNGSLSEWYCTACPWSIVVSGGVNETPEQDVRELFEGHICAHNQKRS